MTAVFFFFASLAMYLAGRALIAGRARNFVALIATMLLLSLNLGAIPLLFTGWLARFTGAGFLTDLLRPEVLSRMLAGLAVANAIVGFILVLQHLLPHGRWTLGRADDDSAGSGTPDLRTALAFAFATFAIISMVQSESFAAIRLLGRESLDLGEGGYRALRTQLISVTESTSVGARRLETYGIGLVLPLLCLNALYAALARGGRVWWVIWAATQSMWLFSGVASFSRNSALMPVLGALTCYAFTVYHTRGFKAIRLSWVGLTVAAMIGVLLLTGTAGSQLVFDLLSRAVVVPAISTYGYFYTYPYLHDFTSFAQYGTSGSTLAMILGAIGIHPAPLGDTLDVLTGKLLYGLPMTFNTSPVGEGWASAGYAGIVVTVALGFGTFLIFDLLVGRVLLVPRIPLLAFFVSQALTYSNGGVSLWLLSGGALTAPILATLFFGRVRIRARRERPAAAGAPAIAPLPT